MDDDNELRQCHAEIRRLKAENQDLRRASESFGSLAERLNRALLAERLLRPGERLTPRDPSDSLAERLNRALHAERRLRPSERHQTSRDSSDSLAERLNRTLHPERRRMPLEPTSVQNRSVSERIETRYCQMLWIGA
jgi:hypothetical protein